MKIKILVMMLACAYVFAQQRDQKSEFANDAVQTTIANANVSTDAALKIPQTKPASKKSGEPQEYADLKVMPSPKTLIMPVYPQVAKLAGIQGKVYVEATIDEKGNVVETKILKSDHESLEAAAVDAIKNTKFNPGVSKSNKKVKAKVVVPIVFKLEGNDAEVGKKTKDNSLLSEISLTAAVPIGEQDANAGDVEPDIDANIPFEKGPEMIRPAKPNYPDEAKAKGITGKAFVKVLIDKEGNAKKAVIIKSDHWILSQPSIDAAMKSKFSPALQKGKPVSVWAVLPYKYTLEKQDIDVDVKTIGEDYKTIEKAKEVIENVKGMKDLEKYFPQWEKIKANAEIVEIKEKYGDESVLMKTTGAKGDVYILTARKGTKVLTFLSPQIEKLRMHINKLIIKEAGK